MPALGLWQKMCIERLFSNEMNWDLHEAVNEMWKPEMYRLDMCMGSPVPLQHSHKNLISIFEK